MAGTAQWPRRAADNNKERLFLNWYVSRTTHDASCGVGGVYSGVLIGYAHVVAYVSYII